MKTAYLSWKDGKEVFLSLNPYTAGGHRKGWELAGMMSENSSRELWHDHLRTGSITISDYQRMLHAS